MRTLHAAIFLLLSLGASASAQKNSSPLPLPIQNNPGNPGVQMGVPTIGGPNTRNDDLAPSPDALHRIEVIRANERQQKMVADTQHLLALATELKADMDKTTKDTLSVDVIKKADQIEKLAHDIKQRMKN
jgi:hypothetical protein